MYYTKPKERVSTALLLAAGMGNRMQHLTNDIPKCLIKVNEKPILEHLVACLHQYNFERLIVIVGYLEQNIRNYLDKIAGNLSVEYIVNPEYMMSNNIYSLWLARKKIQEPFLLIESDLIFDPHLLEDMLLPDRIAVSHKLPWMNGTTVTTDGLPPHRVTAFHIDSRQNSNVKTYKTVNICSLSLAAWQRISKRLDAYISAGRVNDYYESVFAEMTDNGCLTFQSVFFDTARWYEIDTPDDLCKCERIFNKINIRDNMSFNMEAETEIFAK